MSAVPDYRKYNIPGQKSPALLGLLNGIRQVPINGHNGDVDIGSVPEDITNQGGVYAFQSAAVAMEVLSGSANDAAAGTGARTVQVSGLNASYAEISEVIILNGVTPVPTVNLYFRINSFVVVTAGSSLANEGILTVRVIAGAVVQSQMAIGLSIAHQGIYTVPANHTLIIQVILNHVSSASGKVDVGIQSRVSTTDAPFITRTMIMVWGFQNAPNEFANGIVFTEKTDIRFRVLSSQQDNTEVGFTLSGLLYRIGDDGL